jgi:phosphatidylserine decarboxylase
MIARGTNHWIISAGALCVLSSAVLFVNTIKEPGNGSIESDIGQLLLFCSTLLFIILTVFFLIFFRDPERSPSGSGIVAPADGIIKSIEKESRVETDYTRIITFMNVHNVHVNRIPLDGKVISIERISGGYLPAYKPGAIKNNQVKTVLKTRIGEVDLYQITGAFARRIVVYIAEGDKVNRGDRLGMIKFGSRVDIVLPSNKISVNVKPGMKVKANLTTLAEERS